VDDQVPAMARLKRAAHLLEPAFELSARHRAILQHFCCMVNRCVVFGKPARMAFCYRPLEVGSEALKSGCAWVEAALARSPMPTIVSRSRRFETLVVWCWQADLASRQLGSVGVCPPAS
jgi:hypothetical protein